MEDEIYEFYKKVKDKCSEEEFQEKMMELEELLKDDPYSSKKTVAQRVVSIFKDKEEEVGFLTEFGKVEKIADFEIGNTEKNVAGRVISIGNKKGFTRKTKKPGTLCNIEIADDTGSLRVTLWTENMKHLNKFSEGDIIQIDNIDIKEGFRGGIQATCKPRTAFHLLDENEYPTFPKYNEPITNIADIIPETEVNIIARLTRIPNVRTYEKDGKEGQVTSLEIQDATGKISYTLWNKNTDLIKTLPLNEGDTVKILKARAREREGEISLTHWDGRIIKGDFDVPEFEEPLEPIADVREKKNVSVMGIITKIQDSISFTRQNGSEGLVRSIEIRDDTGAVKVTLWNDDAKMPLNKGDIIKITGGNGEFDDYSESGYRINTGWNASYVINPDIESPLMDYLREYKEQIGPISLGQLQEIEDDGIEVDVIGRIITVSDIHEFQRDDGNIGLVRSVDFSDGEGVVQLSFWGEKTQEKFEIGEAYQIENARTKMGMYAIDLNVGRTSRIIKLTEEQASFLPTLISIQKSIFNLKSIDEIEEDDRNIMVLGRVIESYNPREFERADGTTGLVKTIEIGDNSGTISVSLWDENAKLDFELGQAVKVQNPSVRVDDNNRLQLSLSRSSAILEPSDDELFKLPSFDELKESVYQNKTIDSLDEVETNVILTGQFRDPYSSRLLLTKCPFCGNNLELTGEEEICSFCGEIVDEPRYLLMIPGRIEDETGEISVTFFDNLAEELLEMTKEEIIATVMEEGDLGVMEGKIEDLDGLTLEVLGNIDFDEYNEEKRIRPKQILNKYY